LSLLLGLLRRRRLLLGGNSLPTRKHKNRSDQKRTGSSGENNAMCTPLIHDNYNCSFTTTKSMLGCGHTVPIWNRKIIPKESIAQTHGPYRPLLRYPRRWLLHHHPH
jgi:hypothetical protein